MPGGRYPWAVRAGGPLLGGGGESRPPLLFSWKPQIVQTKPASTVFARADEAQILTTSDGVKEWFQTAKVNETLIEGARRVQNLVVKDLVDWSVLQTGAASAPVITPDFAQDPGGEMTAVRVQLECGGTASGDRCGLTDRASAIEGDRPYVVSFWFKLNAETSRDIEIFGAGATLKTITITDEWQRFADLIDATQDLKDITFRARGSISGATTIDLLVADGTSYGPQLEDVRDAANSVGEFVNKGIEYDNIGAVGVRYFATTNGNVIETSGVVTPGSGVAIVGAGWLPQFESTNRLLHSNDMTQVDWVATGVAAPTDLGQETIGANATSVAGLGALGVDDISQGATGFALSTTIAPSMAVRRVSATGVLRIINTTGAANGEWTLDLELIGDDWVRLRPGDNVPGFVEVAAWVSDGAGAAGIAYHALSGGPLTVDFAFNNMENGVLATSPIITTTLPVTRAADTSVLSETWPAEHSAFIDATVPLKIVPSIYTPAMFGYTSSKLVFVSDNNQVRFSNGLQVTITALTPYEGERHKFAYSAKDDEGILVDDEGNSNEDLTSTITLGTINLAQSATNANVFSGRINEIDIYDGTQTKAQLKQLTGAPPLPSWKIFLVAGQSNCMRGFELQPSDALTTPGISQWGRQVPNIYKIIDAFEPLENYDPSVDAIGFAYVFAKLYLLDNPDDSVLLIPTARGASGFDNNFWNPGDVSYNDAIDRTNAALAETEGEFLGILWHQGEEDADAGISEVVHAANLDAMVAGMRADITGATNAPFILGEMSQDWVSDDAPTRTPVQSAIQDTPNRLTDCALVSSTGLVVYDTIHFDDDSQRTLGQRYYDEYEILVP